jgi:hypothetical protein
VSLATSYYSDLAAEHDKVTGRRGSHARTRANIAQAVARQIPIRAGIIGILDHQRVQQAARTWPPWACSASASTGGGRSDALPSRTGGRA